MARGFGTTYGTGANSDNVLTNASFTTATKISYALWCYINGSGGGTNGLIFTSGAGSALVALRLSGGTTTMFLTAPWSTTRGDFTFTHGQGTGKWFHVCVTYNGSSTANKPTVYVNGAPVTVTTSATPVGTYGGTMSPQYIGNSSGAGAVGWDGLIAHLAMWNGDLLTQGEAAALANGLSPLLVRPVLRAVYMPLYGVTSSEPNLGYPSSVGTVTGTKFVYGPPLSQVASRLPPSNAPVAPRPRAGSLDVLRPRALGRPFFVHAQDAVYAQLVAQAASISGRGFTDMPMSARNFAGM